MPPSRLRPLPALLAFSLLLGACSAAPEPSSPTGSDIGSEDEPATRELSFDGPASDEVLSADELRAVEFVVTASVSDGSAPETGDLRLRLDGEDVTDEAQLDDGALVYAPATLADGKRLVEVVSVPPGAGDTTAGSGDTGQADASAESGAGDTGQADASGEPGAGDTGQADASGESGAGEPASDANDASSVDEPVAGGPAAAEDGDEPTVLHEWSFSVDTTPPEIELTSPTEAVIAGEPVTVAGTTEADATVSAAGTSAEADDAGAFSFELDAANEGPLPVVVTDAAGNVSETEANLLTIPSRVETDEVRAVHVSFCAWATPSFREPILAMIEDGVINAVQLDLKDETGTIGFETDIELAATIGADEPPCRIDLDAAVEQLHGLGVPIIGRVVAFADPVLAPWAWENGHRDWVLQTADGDMYTGRYAGFSNFAHPEVVAYNLDIAEAAAAAGVDHILWDYIRKPDGPLENFRFVGLEGDPGDAIVEFTRLADERIAPYGAAHGASVYGISADRPTEVAQNIPAMAEHLDYVAPMLYPSHWGPGEYGIDDPLHAPYDTIHTTLEIWLDATEGKRARVVPWLEDSAWPISLGYPDRADYVSKQIQATYDRGIHEWILWDSAVDYTTSAITQPPEE